MHPSLLIAIDREIAEATRKKGCDCGGALHQSNYPRSPFGLSAEFRIAYEERFSFCCADCRKRTTPSSVRFFGRRWYPAPLLLLIWVQFLWNDVIIKPPRPIQMHRQTHHINVV